jgi:hypothetical protein
MTVAVDSEDYVPPITVTADHRVEFVSHSALELHRKCPQAWQYRYLRGLTEIEGEKDVHLELGTWWLALRALDAVNRGQELGTLKSAPRVIQTPDGAPDLIRSSSGTGWAYVRKDQTDERVESLADFMELIKVWWKTLKGDIQEAWTEKLGVHPALHLHRMDLRFWNRWGEDIAAEEPIAVELKFRRQLPGVDTVLGGYIDEIYRDNRRGLIVARDVKTANSIVADSEDDMMDSQLQLYAWGASPLVKTWIGRGINAVGYDRIRSKPPTTPVVTQSGTLSKTVSDYDLATYIEWAERHPTYPGRKKDGSQAGVYEIEQAVIDKLSLPAMRDVWTQRSRTPLNRNIVRAHLQAAIDTQRAAEQTSARVAASGEAARNLSRMGCKWCSFQHLCRAEMIGGPNNDFLPEEYGLRVAPRGR